VILTAIEILIEVSFLSGRNGEILGRDPFLVEELVPVSTLSADVSVDVNWVGNFRDNEGPALLRVDSGSKLPLLLAILAVEEQNISLRRFIIFPDVDRSAELIELLEQVRSSKVFRFPLGLEVSRNADALGELSFRKGSFQFGISHFRGFWWSSSD